MLRRCHVVCLATLIVSSLVFSAAAWAKDKKDKPQQVILLWPDQSNPTLRLTFGKFTQEASYDRQLSLQTQVLIENMSSKRIPLASFTVYLLDKDKVRIGSGNLSISDLDPGQLVKQSFQVLSVGIPTTLNLVARNDENGVPSSLKTVPLKVVSVPPGASLRVDGRDEGVTPATVRLTVGKHTLAFSKEGYASGSTPVEVKPDEAPGGSVSFELGGLSRDNVELRNGTVVQGDLLSLSMIQVVIRVDGKDQTYDRNQVRKIILVERETAQQPAVVQSVGGAPKQ